MLNTFSLICICPNNALYSSSFSSANCPFEMRFHHNLNLFYQHNIFITIFNLFYRHNILNYSFTLSMLNIMLNTLGPIMEPNTRAQWWNVNQLPSIWAFLHFIECKFGILSWKTEMMPHGAGATIGCILTLCTICLDSSFAKTREKVLGFSSNSFSCVFSLKNFWFFGL